MSAVFYPTDKLQKDLARLAVGKSLVDFTGSYSLYFALLTALPDDGVGGINFDPSVADILALEVTATGYARGAVTLASVAQDVMGGQAYSANSAAVVFGPFSGTGGLPSTSYGALVTSASGTSGKVHSLWDFSSNPVSAPQGESVEIATGALTISHLTV